LRGDPNDAEARLPAILEEATENTFRKLSMLLRKIMTLSLTITRIPLRDLTRPMGAGSRWVCSEGLDVAGDRSVGIQRREERLRWRESVIIGLRRKAKRTSITR
jgi:hypothetical protein